MGSLSRCAFIVFIFHCIRFCYSSVFAEPIAFNHFMKLLLCLYGAQFDQYSFYGSLTFGEL